MNLIERFNQVIDRIGSSYPMHVVLIEMATIWVSLFFIVWFLRGTRGARVIKGLGLLLFCLTVLVQVYGDENNFERLNYLSSQFFGLAALAVVIVFQPELRRALVTLGDTSLFRRGGLEKRKIITQVVEAVTYLSKNKIGALVAVERNDRLDGLVEAGTPIHGRVTKEILNTIFWPGTALHDLGVVIRGELVLAAGVQFPLAETDSVDDSELGSRHRSALGLSQEADSIVIIVSEETGTISVAERGKLTRHLTPDALESLLIRGLDQLDLAQLQEDEDDLPPPIAAAPKSPAPKSPAGSSGQAPPSGETPTNPSGSSASATTSTSTSSSSTDSAAASNPVA